ncbi:MAG: metallophosphoesterase family protein [Clostridia bacterium]|nr:metallophosphoesterase family protein [Clostridia bacterium]
MRLPDRFQTKHPLRFRKDGGYRILMMSDAHLKPDKEERTLRAMETLIDGTRPDLVLLNGDNVSAFTSPEMFERLLAQLVEPMETRRIPWAHVFGNHDQTPEVSKKYQEAVYESYPWCVSKAGPEELTGCGNYFLPVLDENDEPVFGVWGIDSQQDFKTQTVPLSYPGDLYWDVMMPSPIVSYSDYDLIRFEQVMWYWNTSVELEKLCGHKIPSLMMFHIPLIEFHGMLLNAHRTKLRGEYNERLSTSEINSGIFAAAFQRGDVKAMFAGHDHINTFDGIYCGIRMGFDGSIGYEGYGCRDNDPGHDRERLRGGRIFDISKDDPWNIKTDMVFVKDILARANPDL